MASQDEVAVVAAPGFVGPRSISDTDAIDADRTGLFRGQSCRRPPIGSELHVVMVGAVAMPR